MWIDNNTLSVENEELTPTMKLKRFFIQQKYKHVIDTLYDEDDLPPPIHKSTS